MSKILGAVQCLKKSIVAGIFIIMGIVMNGNILYARENVQKWYPDERSEQEH